MGLIIYPIYALVSVILFVWGLAIFGRIRLVSIGLALLIIAGMIYDNVIISISGLLGAGSLLESLSFIRYIVQSITMPLIIAITFTVARQAGLGWAKNTLLRYGAWVITAALIVYGLVNNFAGLLPDPINLDGNLRYLAVKSTLPVLLGVSTVLVAIMGALIWRATKSPWIFIAAMLGLLSSAVPGRSMHFILGTATQILLVGSLLATAQSLWNLRTRESDDNALSRVAVDRPNPTSLR